MSRFGSRLRGIVLAPLVVGVLLGGAWSAGVASAAPSLQQLAVPSAWQQVDFPAAANPRAISCPTASFCMAVGEATQDTTAPTDVVSTDGGAHWSNVVMPAGFWVQAVSCTSSSDCVITGYEGLNQYSAGGGAIFRTTDGGGTWTNDSLPPSLSGTNGQVDAVSCNGLTCVAGGTSATGSTGYAVLSSSDGGVTWNAATLPGAPAYEDAVGGVACPSAASCYLVGPKSGNTPAYLYASTDGGVTWSSQSVPAGVGNLASVSCVSTTDCTAVGAGTTNATAIITTTNGGSVWTSETVPAAAEYLESVSCVLLTEFCTAAGAQNVYGTAEALISSDGGVTWTPSAVAGSTSSYLYGVSCATSTQCVAVGSNVYLTTDAGASWSNELLPIGDSYMSKLSCPTATMCVGLMVMSDRSVQIASSSDGGSTWSFQSPPIPILNDLKCLSALVCIAVGNSGDDSEIARTVDGGVTWSAITTPDTAPTPLGISQLSCPTSSVCYGFGGEPVPLIVSTDAGATWTSAGTPPNGPTAFDCATADVCYLDGVNSSGAFIDETEDGGQTWRQIDYPNITLTGLTCTSATTCFAYGAGYAWQVVLRLTDDGQGWTKSTVPNSQVPTMSGVACPLVNQCVAVSGTDGYTEISADNGATWAATSNSYLPFAPSIGGLTCSPTKCFAFGSAGVAVVYSMISPAAFVPNVTSVSPAAGSTDGGTAVTITGSNFVPGATSVTFGSLAATSVTCSSSTSCVATSPAESAGSVPVIVSASGDSSTPDANSAFTYQTPPPPSPPPTHGYWLVGADGGIFSFGSAQFYGSTGALRLQRPVVGIAPTGGRSGYWLVASDGGAFAFGSATYKGSIPGLGLAPAGSGAAHELNAPIVGLVPSVDGNGYFMVGADGGVFTFGDAAYEGSCPGIGGCSGTAVAVVPDATGAGYWIMTSTGHVYAFGDAQNEGQPGPQLVPVTSAAATPDGKGYWILFSNGVVGAYGDAATFGDPAGLTGGNNPAAAIFTTSDGQGYWVATAAGKVYPYGDAPADGDMSGTHLNAPIIAASGS